MPEPIYKQQSKITLTDIAPILLQILLKADKEIEAALVRVASDPKLNKSVRVAAQTKLAQRNADKTKRRVIQRTNKKLSPLVENLIELKAVKSATDLDPDVRNAKAMTQNNGVIVDANAITRAKTLDNINNGGFFWNTGNGFNYTPNYLTLEGRDAIEQQNTTNALNTSVGLSMGFSGPVLQSYGFPALLTSILGGYAGNELGTKAVSLFTDDPRWQAAGGLAGMLIGGGTGFKLGSTNTFLTPEQLLALLFLKATGVNYWNPAPGQVSRYINRQIAPTYNYPIIPTVNGVALEPKGQIELIGLKAQSPQTLAVSPWAKVRANPSKLLKPADFVPEQTRFLYTGPKHSISEVVNSDGTVNVQKALQIANAEADRQGGWRMSLRLENPEWHKTDPNTFLHTKEVAQRAWQIPTPAGYTKLDLMFAALGHDFGKMFAGEGHGEIGADYLRQMFPDMTDAQYNAIARHMMSEDVARMQFSDQPLTLATMGADRGGNVIPLSQRNNFNLNNTEYWKDSFGEEILEEPYPGSDMEILSALGKGMKYGMDYRKSPEHLKQILETMGWDDLAMAEYVQEQKDLIGRISAEVSGFDEGMVSKGRHRSGLNENGKVIHLISVNRNRMPTSERVIEAGVHEMGGHGMTGGISPEDLHGIYLQLAEKFPRTLELMLKNEQLKNQTLVYNDTIKEILTKELYKKVEEWRKQGLTDEEIESKAILWGKFKNRKIPYISDTNEITTRAITENVIRNLGLTNSSSGKFNSLGMQEASDIFTPESLEKFIKVALSNIGITYGLSQLNQPTSNRKGGKLIPRKQYASGGELVKDYVLKNYGNFEWINPDDILMKGQTPYKGSLLNFLMPTNSEYDKLDDWYKMLIDESFNLAFDKGLIKLKTTPETTVYGIPHLRLYTYPPSISGYLPGHSRLEYPGLSVSRSSNSKHYNLISNNCSDSTNCAIEDLLGDRYQWLNDAIVTPEKVHKQLLKVKGAKDQIYDDVTITTIPVYSSPKNIHNQDYYENSTSGELKRK